VDNSIIDPQLLTEPSTISTRPASDVPQAQPEVPHSTGSAQVVVPVTWVIPPTPLSVSPRPTTTDVSTHAVPVPDDLDLPPQSSDSGDGPSTPTSGHRMAAINAVLAATYKQLEDVLTNTVEQTSLTVQQVLDNWHKSYARVVNGINYWNCYASYLAKHEEQEW